MIAVLFANRRGIYAGRPDVDLWDETRDARQYPGPRPVVAHPPCARWCQLAAVVEKRWGHRRGDDGGCFAAALAAVRTFGGVLEHPAFSHAWAAYGLPRPSRAGGWTQGACGGWSCHVEQGHYGHPARKATWLYAVRTPRPDLHWGPAPEARALVSWCGNHVRADETRPRVSKAAASATPPAFAEVLLAMARSAA